MVEEWVPPEPHPDLPRTPRKKRGPPPADEVEGASHVYGDDLTAESPEDLFDGEDLDLPDKKEAPKPSSEVGPLPSKEPTFQERVLGDLPLIVVGVLFFIGAFFFFSHGAGFGNRVYPVWVLFVALGSIATTGGLVSVYVGPDPPTLESSEIDLSAFVVISREEWNQTRAELQRLRASMGSPSAAAEGVKGLGLTDDSSHASLLAEVEGMGGGDRPPSPFAQPGLPIRTRAAASSSSLLPQSIVGHAPPEAPGAPEVAPTNGAARLPGPLEVQVPPVPEGATPALLRNELDQQITGALRGLKPASGPVPSPTLGGAASRALPATPAIPSPPSRVSTPKPEVPRAAARAPPAAPAPVPPAPSGEGQESFDEETGEGTGTDHATEIEDLAKRFGALVSPTGFFSAPEAISPVPPISTDAVGVAKGGAERPTPPPNTWSLPNLRALRPWPGSGRFEWEMASLRIAIDYCIPRNEGEEPEAFMDRAELLLQQGVPIPPADRVDLDRAYALFGSLLAAYRHLTTREIVAFSTQVRPEVERGGRSIGFPLRPGEDLVNYAQHMQGVLAVFETSGVRPVPEAPATTGPSGGPSESPDAPKKTEVDAIDDELDRLMSEVDKQLPAGSAPVSSKKKRTGSEDPPA